MTQSDVLKYLKKNRRYILAKDIAKEFGINIGTATSNLNKLYKQGLVMRKNKNKKRETLFGGASRPYLWRIK